MGVVYLGHDTRLDRPVAIKALPENLAADADRLARFEREARTLAVLNHPNVAGIYGVEDQNGAKYLILEYVEGETLADRIDRGPIPIDEAIDIAAQIALGVEAAHEAGVIHRDLKPANVKLTPEGQVKVLDFGLARADESSSSSSASEVATITSPAHSPTMPGVILGTAAYMSPEQARGRKLDKRTDIWSFGVMLYEMLTGASPFRGETVSDSIGAVLHKNVDESLLPRDTPRGVRRVLHRCVERDKNLRYRDIGDARVDLLQSPAISEDLAPLQTPSPVRWFSAVVIIAIVCLIGGWFGAAWLRPTETHRIAKFDVIVESDGARLTDANPKISPSGDSVAYIENGQVFVRDFSTFESRPITGAEDAINVFWSPDGAWLGYYTDNAFYKAAVSGGATIKLTSQPLRLSDVAGGGWTIDDQIVFAEYDGGLVSVSARGGAPSPFLQIDRSVMLDFHDPSVVRGTNTVLFIEHRRDNTYAISATDGEQRTVIVEFNDSLLAQPVYSPSGHVVFSRGTQERSVWGVAFDPVRFEGKGEPFLIEPEGWHPSVANNGTLAFLRGNVAPQGNLALVTRDGEVTPIEGEFDGVWGPLLAPEGDRVFFAAGIAPKTDVWIHELDRGVNRRITFTESFLRPVAWSADGTEVAVNQYTPASDPPVTTLFLFADGSGESRPAVEGLVYSLDAQWRTAAWIADPTREDSMIYAATIEDIDSRSPVMPIQTNFFGIELSPDGTLLVYTSDESGENEIYCTRFPEGSGKWQVSTRGGESPRWSKDGKRLYFESGGSNVSAVFEVDVIREPALQFSVPRMVIDAESMGLDLDQGWSPSADGSTFVVKRSVASTTEQRVAVSVIQNWFEEHRDR